MKTLPFKLTVLLFVCFTFSNTISAQSPFVGDSKVVHLGAAIGAYDIDVTGSLSSTPIFSVAYDHGIIEGLGIGTLAIGGIAGIKRYSAGNSNWNRAFLFARATYHFDFVNSEVLDLYAGAMAGTVFFVGGTDGLTSSSTQVSPGAFAGINYYFTPSFGVFAEAGFGFGLLHGGVAFNL